MCVRDSASASAAAATLPQPSERFELLRITSRRREGKGGRRRNSRRLQLVSTFRTHTKQNQLLFLGAIHSFIHFISSHLISSPLISFIRFDCSQTLQLPPTCQSNLTRELTNLPTASEPPSAVSAFALLLNCSPSQRTRSRDKKRPARDRRPTPSAALLGLASQAAD